MEGVFVAVAQLELRVDLFRVRLGARHQRLAVVVADLLDAVAGHDLQPVDGSFPRYLAGRGVAQLIGRVVSVVQATGQSVTLGVIDGTQDYAVADGPRFLSRREVAEFEDGLCVGHSDKVLKPPDAADGSANADYLDTWELDTDERHACVNLFGVLFQTRNRAHPLDLVLSVRKGGGGVSEAIADIDPCREDLPTRALARGLLGPGFRNPRCHIAAQRGAPTGAEAEDERAGQRDDRPSSGGD